MHRGLHALSEVRATHTSGPTDRTQRGASSAAVGQNTYILYHWRSKSTRALCLAKQRDGGATARTRQNLHVYAQSVRDRSYCFWLDAVVDYEVLLVRRCTYTQK